MSFHNADSEPGALSREAEAEGVVEGVCKSITAERWFAPGMERREEFASYVQEIYQRGLVLPDQLHKHCRLSAQAHFAQPGLPDNGAWIDKKLLQ